MGRDAADILTGGGVEALRRLLDEAPEIGIEPPNGAAELAKEVNLKTAADAAQN